MGKKRVPFPEQIDLDLQNKIFEGYDELIMARVEATAAKETAKEAKGIENAAQERLNDLLREAQFYGVAGGNLPLQPPDAESKS